MANNDLGVCACPLCGKDASVRETKKAKAYILCDDCGFQGFARGHTADKLLRGKMRNVTPATPAPAANVTKPATPAPAANVTKPDTPAPATPAPAPKPKKELTIFDAEMWKGAPNE